jgi:hypothetical protein
MPFQSRQAAFLSPSAITVQNKGDMARESRYFFHIFRGNHRSGGKTLA